LEWLMEFSSDGVVAMPCPGAFTGGEA